MKRIVSNTDLMPKTLTPAGMGLETLDLVRSFCFVGDLGYDPGDLTVSARIQTDETQRPE